MNISNHNHTRGSERKEESPPYCRIFVVCNKKLRENDLQERFERFGQIEDLYMPRDRNTGDSKGVAYIKYAKTSSAAHAIQEMNMKPIGEDSKPLKVMVAANRNENISQIENEDRYKRLFIKVPRNMSESEVRQHFSNFGNVESVFLHRDRVTEVSKGFAYVHYKTFYEAAKAFEECDKSYKPVFATPKEDLKRSRHSLDSDSLPMKSNYNNHSDHYHPHKNYDMRLERPTNMANECNVVSVKCSPQLPRKYIERLFDIVPGMTNIQYSMDTYNGISKALITYDNSMNASFAIEKLHNYEFPSGEILSVKLDTNPLSRAANDLSNIVNNFKCAVDSGIPDIKQLADAIAKASSLITAATTGQIEVPMQMDSDYCDVSLPSPKPMVDMHSRVAQRLFIICKPQPPLILVLKDVFSRFGDLIHVSAIPGKTFGFAKYASTASAQEAMRALNGATVTGVRLKVLEADEKPSRDEGLDARNDNQDYKNESKRIRIGDED